MLDERMKCPFCAELIKTDAKKCRFCGEWLIEENGVTKRDGPPEKPEYFKSEQEEIHKVETEEAEKANGFKPTKRTEPKYIKKRRPFPWLRIILFVGYIGIIVALVCSELNAHRLLYDAQSKENAQDYEAAFELYREIIEVFPYSFAVIKTQQGLQRLSDSHDFAMPRPSWLTPVEDVLGRDSNVCEVYLLPFITWPVCAVLLALVFLTRILRPGMAFLDLLLLAVAILGTVAQLSWYGRILSEPLAKGIAERPVFLYCASYVLFIVTALMTLTATRKKRSFEVINKKAAEAEQ